MVAASKLTRRRGLALVLLAIVAVLVRKVRKNAFLSRAAVAFMQVLWEKLTLGYFARSDGFVLSGKDVTREWLETELQRRYGITRVAVASLEATPMGAETGNVSTMFRLKVKYSTNTPGLPETMVLKSPRNEFAHRIPFMVTYMNEMEPRFYQILEPELTRLNEVNPEGLGVHFPETIAVRHNKAGNFYVLMEDVTLKGARMLTEDDEITSVEEASYAMRSIASFHGPFWDLPPNKCTLIVNQNDPVLGLTSEFMKAGWDQAVAKMGSRMPKDLSQRGKLLIQISQRLHDYMSGGFGGAPCTIVHGDCHLSNSFKIPVDPNDESKYELGLYDFQMLRRGNPMLDLASFLAGSTDANFLANHLDELLQVYLDRVAEFDDSARTQLTVEDLGRDFRLALAVHFSWNIAASLAIPFDTPAAEQYKVYFTRMCAAVDRLEVIDTALSYFGGRTLGCDLYRGKTPNWEIPPVQRFVPNSDDLLHKDEGIVTYRAKLAELQPGLWNRIKYELKYRLMERATRSRKGYHGQKTTDLKGSYLEGAHPVEWAQGTPVETSAFDSYYLSTFAPFEEGKPSLALRICKRPQDDEGEVWLVIKNPGDAIYTWVQHRATTARVVYENSSTVMATSEDKQSVMRFICDEPMERWRATFSGKIKNNTTGEIVDASFDLSWTKNMDMFSFGTNVSPSLTARALALETFSKEWGEELKAAHQEHYELFGTTKGNLMLDGKKLKVHGRGMRDRAFGIRDWGYMQRYVAHYFWTGSLEKSSFFNLTMPSLPVLSNAKFGFVCPSGGSKASTVNAMSGNLGEIGADGTPAKEFWQSVECNNITYTMKAFVEKGDTALLDMGPGRMLVNIRFTKFEVTWVNPENGHLEREIGYGGSEYAYRFNDYIPPKPCLADLKHLPVTGENQH